MNRNEPVTFLTDDYEEAVKDAGRRNVSLWERHSALMQTKRYASGTYDGLIDDLGYATAGGFLYMGAGVLAYKAAAFNTQKRSSK